MIELIVTRNLSHELPASHLPARLIANRKISANERALLRAMGVRRFFLPALSPQAAEDFFGAFDRFWDSLVVGFGPEHSFWRNAVSSKMQEWERSGGYLTLVLFTLTQIPKTELVRLLVLTSSWQEEALWKDWAQRQGWRLLAVPGFAHGRILKIDQEIKNFLLFGYYSALTLRKKFFSPRLRLGGVPKEKPAFLLASLFYNGSFKDEGYQDPFLGKLHRFLQENGKHPCYLNDFLDIPNRQIADTIEQCREVTVNVPYALLSWMKLIGILLRVFQRRIKVKTVIFNGCDFTNLMAWNLRRFSHDFNLTAEIYFEAVNELCRRKPLEHLIFVFEGNVFERACVQAFRGSGRAKVTGYSHAVVYPLNLKLRVSPQEQKLRPAEDTMVCTGLRTLEILARLGARDLSRLRRGCSLRTIPLNSGAGDFSQRTHVLIALDGVRTTSAVLDWLSDNVRAVEDFTVIIRFHPNVPVEAVISQCLVDLPSGFVLSSGTLEEDLQRSFCVIYRQTSIGIQAMMNDVPAIHLAVDVPLPTDPIEDVFSGKWKAQTAEELKAALREISGLKPGERQKRLAGSRGILEEYFAPSSGGRLADFLEN